MRKIMMIALMTMSVMMANAQGGLKRVYNESIDPMTQIDEALTKAKADGKFVVCRWAATGALGASSLLTSWRRIPLSIRW